MKKTALIASVLAIVALTGGTASAQRIRGHSFHSGGHVIFPSHHGFYFSYSYLPYGYYPYGYGYYYGGYPYPPAYPWYGSAYAGGDVAYVDTDVSPEKASVYLDGEYVGVADDFDGFPAYLPMEPGRHTITFKADGCLTVTRKVRVPRGAILDMDFTMPRGTDKTSPGSKTDDEEVVVPEQQQGPAGQGYEQQQGSARQGYEQQPDTETASEPGFLRLKVAPPDASVYIDGDLFGSGSTLGGLHGDLRLDPGMHRIEVVRPGYRAVTRNLKVESGNRSSLTITLEKD